MFEKISLRTEMAPKNRKIKPHRKLPPPRVENLEKFISREAKRRYHDSLETMSFVPERGFVHRNEYFNYIIRQLKWTKLGTLPSQGIAQVVCEFHANLPYRDNDTTVFVKGVWVSFNSNKINKEFDLEDEDSPVYQKLWKSTNYDQILDTLTDNTMPWKKNSSNKVFSFSKTGLTPSSRVWHYSISSRLRPSKYVSIVSQKKAILNFAIAQRMKFYVGHVIETSITKASSVKCTEVLTHPSLITRLFQVVRVRMSESKEKCPPIIALPMPKTKKTLDTQRPNDDIDNKDNDEEG